MNKTFLLADDDQDDAELFEEALAEVDSDVRFHHEENGSRVISYLSEAQGPLPSLIFLDLNMPEMNGWQCLKNLKSTPVFSNIPVIMYTTSSFHRDVKIAEELGALGLITKPSSFTVLKSILEKILRSSASDMHATLAEIAAMPKG